MEKMEQVINKLDDKTIEICQIQANEKEDNNNFENNTWKVQKNQTVIRIKEHLSEILKRLEVMENDSHKMMNQLKSECISKIQDLRNNQNKMNKTLSDLNIENENKKQMAIYYPDPYVAAIPVDRYYEIENIEKVLKEKKLEYTCNSDELFSLHFFPCKAKVHMKMTKTALQFEVYLMETDGSGEIIPCKKIPKICYGVYYTQDKTRAQNDAVGMGFSQLVKSRKVIKNINNEKVFEQMSIRKEKLLQPGFIVDDMMTISIQVKPPAKDSYKTSFDGTVLFLIFNVQFEKENNYNTPIPYFYTSLFGHLVHARLILSGKRVSMEIVFENNDFENKLLVPLNYQVTVIFYNHKDFSKYAFKRKRLLVYSLFEMYKFNVCKNEIVAKIIDDDQLYCRIIVDELFVTRNDIKFK